MTEQLINQQLVSELLAKWSERTLDQEEERPRIPLKTLQVEVLQVARLIENNWKTKRVQGKVRHGLESVAASGALSEATPSEIRELQLAVSEAQARYDQVLKDSSNAPLDQADVAISELKAGLSFLLEDGKHEDGAAQLAQLREVHASTDSMESIAMALEGYAELAERFKTELGALALFPLEIIDHSLQIARDLRERSIGHKTGSLVSDQREAIALRNRLLGAMMERVSSARRAIRYVFRDEPELLKEAGSDYQRAVRARSGQSEVAPSGQSEVVPSGGEALDETPPVLRSETA